MRLLSLFTGYGGLDMAVQGITGARLVAVSDISPAANAVLSHYYPTLPNLGDITTIDWSDARAVPQFDIIAGGYPCQPFSTAGHRRGKNDPRHLWPYLLQAIKLHQPQHIYLENVRGHLSLGFDQVLADLAAAGYIVHWSIFAASSIGAPHRRERLYIYARHTTHPYTAHLPHKLPTAGILNPQGVIPKPRADDSITPLHSHIHVPRTPQTHCPSLFPSEILPCPDDTEKPTPQRDVPLLLAEAGARLLPTPNTLDHLAAREGKAIDKHLHRGKGLQEPRRSTMGNVREDIMLTIDPTRYDNENTQIDKRELAPDYQPFNIDRWGVYAEAVARWSLATGTLPPHPIDTDATGKPAMTAEFPCWLMGLPPGYLTHPDIGLTRAEVIALAGNGVVPQAAATAYTIMHSMFKNCSS